MVLTIGRTRQRGAHFFDWFALDTAGDMRFDDTQCLVLQLIPASVNNFLDAFPSFEVLVGDFPSFLFLEELQLAFDECEVRLLGVFGVGADKRDALDGVLFELGELVELGETL